jgi:hypothetical protein
LLDRAQKGVAHIFACQVGMFGEAFAGRRPFGKHGHHHGDRHPHPVGARLATHQI